MSKHSKLMNFLSGMPDFVFDYIEIAYNGESINTQIGYSIDIKVNRINVRVEGVRVD